MEGYRLYQVIVIIVKKVVVLVEELYLYENFKYDFNYIIILFSVFIENIHIR